MSVSFLCATLLLAVVRSWSPALASLPYYCLISNTSTACQHWLWKPQQDRKWTFDGSRHLQILEAVAMMTCSALVAVQAQMVPISNKTGPHRRPSLRPLPHRDHLRSFEKMDQDFYQSHDIKTSSLNRATSTRRRSTHTIGQARYQSMSLEALLDLPYLNLQWTGGLRVHMRMLGLSLLHHGSPHRQLQQIILALAGHRSATCVQCPLLTSQAYDLTRVTSRQAALMRPCLADMAIQPTDRVQTLSNCLCRCQLRDHQQR